MAEFEKIKKMHRSTKFTVHGFVRESRKLFPLDNPYYNLTQLITFLILLYFDEPECFEINEDSNFNYIHKDHGKLYHVYSKRIVTRNEHNKDSNTYRWTVKTGQEFCGAIGIIDASKLNIIKDGSYLWCTVQAHSAFIGSNRGAFGSYLFGQYRHRCTPGLGAIITIDLDWNKNTIKFTSQKTNQTDSCSFSKSLNAVKFVAEFHQNDSEISFAR